MLVAEMHAEVSQLRSELESTRAVAARLASLVRSRPDGAALVPVRHGNQAPQRPAGPGLGGEQGQAVAAAAEIHPQAAGSGAGAG
jgi:hypothetical protein